MKKFLIAIPLLVLVVWGLSAWQKSSVKKADQDKNAYVALEGDVAAKQCVTHAGLGQHIHPELTIIINGKEVEIPANIGITADCMMSLHTHETDGVIHIETPIIRDFTLGNFFAVWGEPLDSTHVLDFTATKAGQIKMTVNGQDVDTFENTILRDKDKIVIEAK